MITWLVNAEFVGTTERYIVIADDEVPRDVIVQQIKYIYKFGGGPRRITIALKMKGKPNDILVQGIDDL